MGFGRNVRWYHHDGATPVYGGGTLQGTENKMLIGDDSNRQHLIVMAEYRTWAKNVVPATPLRDIFIRLVKLYNFYV